MYYFAYGSNMLKSRFENQYKNSDKIGDVIDLGICILKDYEITFNKKSYVDLSGKTNLVEAKGAVTFGVLYKLTPFQMNLLDKIEGGYNRISVFLNWNEEITSAQTFIARKTQEHIYPTKKYLAYLIEGAIEHKFPDSYIKWLESQRVVESIK